MYVLDWLGLDYLTLLEGWKDVFIPSPELFLEAIKMLFGGEPAKRLDSTPRIRKILDRRANAIQYDVTTVKEWIQEEFPMAVTDVTVHTEMDQLRLLDHDEPLAAYYQRAVGILRRTHGRDKPREKDVLSRTCLYGEVKC